MVRVFAYGSNLCIERLQARTPGARVALVGTLAGHALRWHKRCPDGSGKCDAFATDDGQDVVWGVVYEMTPEEKRALDGFEGLGHDYFEKVVSVRTADDVAVEAIAYAANPALLDPSLVPFHWYKGFVTAGAVQHGFPVEYRRLLESIESREDPNAARLAREQAVLDSALRRLGSPQGR